MSTMAFNFKEFEDNLREVDGSYWYTGNLKKHKEYSVCTASHLLLRDCDALGELSEKEDFDLVQFLSCKTTEGKNEMILNFSCLYDFRALHVGH